MNTLKNDGKKSPFHDDCAKKIKYLYYECDSDYRKAMRNLKKLVKNGFEIGSQHEIINCFDLLRDGKKIGYFSITKYGDFCIFPEKMKGKMYCSFRTCEKW